MGCSFSNLISPHTLVSKFRFVLPGLDRADSTPCSRGATACTLAGFHIGLAYWLSVFLRLLLLAHLFNDPLWRTVAMDRVSASSAASANCRSLPCTVCTGSRVCRQEMGGGGSASCPVLLDFSRMGQTR